MRNILIIALCFIAFSVEGQDSLMTSKGVKRDTASLLSAYKAAIATNTSAIAGIKFSGRVFYLSKWGAVSDASLAMNAATGTMGTNNTNAIQAILDSAVNGSIWIICDGKYSADSLRIWSGTRLTILPNCGFAQRDSIRTSFIANRHRTAGTIIDSNIVIDGGGTINARGHGVTGTEFRQYFGSTGFNELFDFRGVNRLTIKDLELLNARTLMVYVQNGNFITIENCKIDQNPSSLLQPSPTFQYIHDGIKLGGPLTNVSVKNCSIYSNDDMISLCPNDAFFPKDTIVIGLNFKDSFANSGNITDVMIDGIIARNCLTGIRILTVSDSLDRISINNVTGVTRDNLAIIDNYTVSYIYYHGTSTGGYIGSLSMNNIKMIVTQNNTGTNGTKNTGISIGTRIKNLSLTNIDYTGYTPTTYPFLKQTAGTTIDFLNASNVRITEDALATNAFTFNGTVTKKIGIWNQEIPPASSLIMYGTGTNRSLSLKNTSVIDNFSNIACYPTTGPNTVASFSLIPKGTAQSTIRSQVDLFNTDYAADATNFEELLIRAAGTSGYGFGSYKSGSSTLYPIWIDATGGFSQAASNVFFNTTGNTGFGTNNTTSGKVTISESSAASYQSPLTILTPNQAAGAIGLGNSILFGKALAVNNAAAWTFDFAGNNSTSNSMALGFWGASSSFFKLFASNKITVNGGSTVPTDAFELTGNFGLTTAGNKLKIASGTNASVGTATLVAGTVTVSTTAALTGSLIYVTVKTAGGTQGFLSVPTITNATSFVINSTSATEASTVNWWIIN